MSDKNKLIEQYLNTCGGSYESAVAFFDLVREHVDCQQCTDDGIKEGIEIARNAVEKAKMFSSCRYAALAAIDEL